MSAETLRSWAHQAEVDDGHRAGLTSAEARRIKGLERENRELRCANEILEAAAIGAGSTKAPQGRQVSDPC